MRLHQAFRPAALAVFRRFGSTPVEHAGIRVIRAKMFRSVLSLETA